MSADFLAVEQALSIKVANITNNMFFKFVFSVIFSPRFNLVISNYSQLFKYILHKIQPHLDNNEDQDGSEASVLVESLLSLYPVISIDHNLALKPSPLSPAFVSL